MVRASVGLAVRDSNVSPGSVFSPTFFSLFIYEMKKYILVLKEFQWWWRWRCFYQVVIVLSGKVSKPAKLVSISETGLNEESSGKRPLNLLQFQEKKFLWCWWFLSSLSDDPPTRQPGHLNIRKGAATSHFLKILVLKQNLLYQWLVVVVQNLSTICFKVSN